MEAASVEIAPHNALSESFLKKIRREVGSALKRAVSKVLGVFDARARVVFIDESLYWAKQNFIKLHETGHAVLPWQKDLYGVIEDCDKTISPEISDKFDCEANVFASEVLFQLDTFTNEASDYEFGIKAPSN